jgi:hypothetical protein
MSLRIRDWRLHSRWNRLETKKSQKRNLELFFKELENVLPHTYVRTYRSVYSSAGPFLGRWSMSLRQLFVSLVTLEYL